MITLIGHFNCDITYEVEDKSWHLAYTKLLEFARTKNLALHTIKIKLVNKNTLY